MSQEETEQTMTKLRKAAVALKYDPYSGSAPTVIAKGRGEIAEKILEQAKSNGIPIQEDKSLVEVLSKLDIDQEIPAELFAVVAEILSFVYQADRKVREWPI